MMRRLARPLLWVVLAVPALLMLGNLARGTVLAMDLLHPSGEMSVRLLILALLPGPLAGLLGAGRLLRGWLSVRRNLGVAAFAYSLLHLALYLIDLGTFAAILGELELPAIWTGWIALALFIPPAAISFDAAMRSLGPRRWKAWQRLVYIVLMFTLAHWLLLEWHWQPAAVHAAPLVAVWLLLFIKRNTNPATPRSPA